MQSGKTLRGLNLRPDVIELLKLDSRRWRADSAEGSARGRQQQEWRKNTICYSEFDCLKVVYVQNLDVIGTDRPFEFSSIKVYIIPTVAFVAEQDYTGAIPSRYPVFHRCFRLL